MGKRTSYTPGTFSWVDLAATDAVAAKSFYAGVFGWEFEDTDAGGGAVYTMCRVGGDAVCGLYQMSDEVREEGASPNWLNYVTVADVDAAAARATEAGGAVLADAFDVLDAGRMAVLEDPQGAVFAVWLPRARIGAERVNDVGCLCMNELATTDMDAATRRVPGSPSSPAKSTRDPRLTGFARMPAPALGRYRSASGPQVLAHGGARPVVVVLDGGVGGGFGPFRTEQRGGQASAVMAKFS